MECEQCVDKISAALTSAGIQFDVNFSRKTVNIHERGDAVVNAQRILKELGYQIA